MVAAIPLAGLAAPIGGEDIGGDIPGRDATPGYEGGGPPEAGLPYPAGIGFPPNGGGAVAGRVVPQLRQNFMPSGFGAWHAGHATGNPEAAGGVCA
jgi:hypothetical protein